MRHMWRPKKGGPEEPRQLKLIWAAALGCSCPASSKRVCGSERCRALQGQGVLLVRGWEIRSKDLLWFNAKCPCDASHESRLIGNLLLLSPRIKHSTGLHALFLLGGFWRGPAIPAMECKSLMAPSHKGVGRGGQSAFSVRQAVPLGMKKCDLERLFCDVCCWRSAGQELGPSPT